MSLDSHEPELEIRPNRDGSTRLALKLDDTVVSQVTVVPFLLRVGSATVRMDGIGGVETDIAFRNQGHSRRLMEKALDVMMEGDAAISMLYGIANFYPKFGYATAGPDYYICLTNLEAEPRLPAGWKVRPFQTADLPAVVEIYEENTRNAVGAAVRDLEGPVWQKMLRAACEDGPVECRVVEDPHGAIAAYAWRGDFWYQSQIEREDPTSMAVAEALARDPESADALLAACRAWGKEEARDRGRSVDRVILAAPPDSRMAAAAMYGWADLVGHTVPCGASMIRLLSVERLLKAMEPELERRIGQTGGRFTGELEIHTEMGSSRLTMKPVHHDHAPESGAEQGISDGRLSSRLFLPQTELARLALGAFPPEDILARLPDPVSPDVQNAVRVLFPVRCPHMYLPDRF